MHMHLPRFTKAHLDELCDELPVDAQRECLAELRIGEQWSQVSICAVLIEVQNVAGRGARVVIEQDPVIAAVSPFQKQGDVAEHQRILIIHFARQHLEIDHIDALQGLQVNAIDVRQLVARWVNLPVVGVALSHHTGNALFRSEYPGTDHRPLRVDAQVVLGGKELVPELIARILHQSIQLRGIGVVGVKLG